MKLAVVIGRFQPFHNGHKAILDRAKEECDQVLVLVGSSGLPRSIRNPLTFLERKKIIEERRVHCLPLFDHVYNDSLWVNEVKEKVSYFVELLDTDPDKVYLYGHEKDHTSYYLKMFPEWGYVPCPLIHKISSTEIRNVLFSEDNPDEEIWGIKTAFYEKYMPLERYRDSFFYLFKRRDLVDEFLAVQEILKDRESLKYPVIDVTVDVLMTTQHHHVLLCKRKGPVGKGLWALPGGYVEPAESLEDAAKRELKEETGIDSDTCSLSYFKAFDNPMRSLRGRSITHLFRKSVPLKIPLIGGDDAEEAKWFHVSEIKRKMMFEDHYSILEYSLSNFGDCK